MKFEQIDGLIFELYSACKSESEWENVLKENQKLYNLKQKWNESELICGQEDKIVCPFSEDERNYLNSKFIDTIYKLNNLDTDTAIRKACEIGNLDVIKWIDEHFYEEWIESYQYPFVWTCENGHIEVAKWFLEFRSLEINPRRAFTCACSNGHLEMAKFLYEYDTTLSSIDTEGLEKDKNLHILKWRYSINPNSVDKRRSLKWAIYFNQIQIAKWIHEIAPDIRPYEIEEDGDESDYEDDTIGQLCEKGALDTILWVKDTFTLDGYANPDNDALAGTCYNGHFETAQWMVDTYNITFPDWQIPRLLEACIHRRKFDVAHFVINLLEKQV